MAAATSAQDFIHLKGVLNDFQLRNETVLFCDNKSSIMMSKNNENSKRTKHIDIKHHYLKRFGVTKGPWYRICFNRSKTGRNFNKVFGQRDIY